MKHDVSHFQKILVIDTTNRETINVALILRGDPIIKSAKTRAQHLQKLTAEILDENNLTAKDLDAVAVLQGPGSYTGTRIGITTANIYGWLYNLPIIEIPLNSFDEALKQLKDREQFSVAKQADALY